eukprot:9477578-Alexandrium_andersonii.AAC.1
MLACRALEQCAGAIMLMAPRWPEHASPPSRGWSTYRRKWQVKSGSACASLLEPLGPGCQRREKSRWG